MGLADIRRVTNNEEKWYKKCKNGGEIRKIVNFETSLTSEVICGTSFMAKTKPYNTVTGKNETQKSSKETQ